MPEVCHQLPGRVRGVLNKQVSVCLLTIVGKVMPYDATTRVYNAGDRVAEAARAGRAVSLTVDSGFPYTKRQNV